MNKICQQYIRNIKSLFPIIGKEEKKYIQQLSIEIEAFMEEESVHNLDELNKKFGNPNDVANNYFRLLDTDILIKRVRISKWVKRGIVIFLFISLISSLIWGCATYHTYKILSEEQAFFQDITID